MAKETGKEMTPHRLSLFQGIRKSMFLFFLSKDNVYEYLELPEALKNDDEIIAEVMAIKPALISYIPTEKALRYIASDNSYIKYITNVELLDYLVRRKPETIRLFDEEFISSYLESYPKLVTYLDEKQIRHFAIGQEPYNKAFLGVLPQEMQEELILSREASALDSYLDCFSEEAIIEAAKKDEKIYNSYMGKRFRNFRWLEKYNLKKLPISTQIKLIGVSPAYVNLISEEAVNEFVNGNPLLYKFLPDKMKLDLIKEDQTIFAQMPAEFQKLCLEKYPKAARYTNISGYFNKEASLGAEQDILSFAKKGKRPNIIEIGEILKDKNDKDYIIQMGMYNPELVFVRPEFSEYANKQIVDIFAERTKYFDEYGRLTRIFNHHGTLGEIGFPNQEEMDRVNRAMKLALNEDILRNVHFEILGDFVDHPSNEKLAEIIRRTYGEESAALIQERPDITDSQIPNYYIFKPEVVEKVGSNNIYSAIYSDLTNAGMISEMARKPELLKLYERFNSITEGFFPNTPNGFNDRLSAFADSKELLENITAEELSEVQKDNLLIALMDRRDIFIGNSKPQEFVSFPKNIIGLNHYQEVREKRLDEAVQHDDDPLKLKNYISKRFFGTSFDKYYDNNESVSPMKIVGIKHSKQLKDLIESKKDAFSKGEMDYFEICAILANTSNPDDLKKIYSVLKKHSVQMNPLRFNKFQKSLKDNKSLNLSDDELAKIRVADDKKEIGEDDSEIIREIKNVLGYSKSDLER